MNRGEVYNMPNSAGMKQHDNPSKKHGLAYEKLTPRIPIIVCIFTIGSTSIGFSQSASTSPLEILSQAPTVSIEDTQPIVPQSAAPVQGTVLPPAAAQMPFAPAPAPPYNEVTVPGQYPPAYSGQSVQSPGQPAGFVPPAPSPALNLPPNSPRPTPPNNEPREGLFKGAIRAIPFVGSKIAGPEKSPIPMPRDQSWRTAPLPQPPEATPRYQGYSTPIPRMDSTPDQPILSPPSENAASPGFTADPYSPESMTLDAGQKLNLDIDSSDSAPKSPARTTEDIVVPAEPAASSNILTVKIDEPTTAAETSTVSTPAPTPEVKETPAPVSTQETPVPLDEPVEAPISTADNAATTSTESPVPASASGESEIIVEEKDLGMPNPAYEENPVVLTKFQEAVKSARNKDYDTAARQFREYATHHPASGLTPRALFLAVIFEKNNALAEESRELLKSRFPDNHYVKQVDKRRPPVTVRKSDGTLSVPVDSEPVADKVARLEKELTLSVGNTEKEPALRIELAQAYIRMEQYDRAMEILRPALDQLKDKPEEADALILLAECHIAKKDVKSAAAVLVEVMEKYPETAKKPKAAWNIGLVYEESGRYEKARTIYNDLRRNFPDTPEAGWAEARLREISTLSD